MEKLQGMTEYVLHLHSMTRTELCEAYPNRFKTPVWNVNRSDFVKDMLAIDAIKWYMVKEYAKFLRRPLTLGMFFPCDLDGNPWVGEEKMVGYGHLKERFSAARERVIFEGFHVISGNG